MQLPLSIDTLGLLLAFIALVLLTAGEILSRSGKTFLLEKKRLTTAGLVIGVPFMLIVLILVHEISVVL